MRITVVTDKGADSLEIGNKTLGEVLRERYGEDIEPAQVRIDGAEPIDLDDVDCADGAYIFLTDKVIAKEGVAGG